MIWELKDRVNDRFYNIDYFLIHYEMLHWFLGNIYKQMDDSGKSCRRYKKSLL